MLMFFKYSIPHLCMYYRYPNTYNNWTPRSRGYWEMRKWREKRSKHFLHSMRSSQHTIHNVFWRSKRKALLEMWAASEQRAWECECASVASRMTSSPRSFNPATVQFYEEREFVVWRPPTIASIASTLWASTTCGRLSQCLRSYYFVLNRHTPDDYKIVECRLNSNILLFCVLSVQLSVHCSLRFNVAACFITYLFSFFFFLVCCCSGLRRQCARSCSQLHYELAVCVYDLLVRCTYANIHKQIDIHC